MYLKTQQQKLAHFSAIQLETIKAQFDTELKTLETEAGIWDEIETWYITGIKP